MSDDKLFASNNAIGRKGYIKNLVILAIIVFATHIIFTDHIIPNVVSEAYEIISKWFLYFLYVIFLITFFALIERRLYDVCGKRETKSYRNTSAILELSVFLFFINLYCMWKKPSFVIPNEMIYIVSFIFDIIFLLIVFILMFLKGKISNLTYEEYRNRIKYE